MEDAIKDFNREELVALVKTLAAIIEKLSDENSRLKESYGAQNN